MSIHILDRYTDKIKDYLTNKPSKKIILDDIHTRNIESNTETFDFTVDYLASENIQPRDRVLIPDEEQGQYREFVVDEIDTDTYDGETEVKTVASYLEDLEKARPIEPQTITQYTTEQAVEFALTHVDWEVGTIEYGGFRTISWTSYNSPYEVLKIIANRFDLQLDFSIEIDGNEISRRLVHLREKTALFDGKEVRRGKDLENLTIKRTSTEVVTALLALAPEPEEGEERVTAIVVDDEAQSQYGRERDYIWAIYEPESNDQKMTQSRLETLARTQLNKLKQPKTDYTIEAVDLEQFLGHEQVRIGDKIRIKDDLQEPYFYSDATVKEVKRSILDPLSKEYTLGDVTEYTREDITKIFEKFRALLTQRMKETQSNLDNIVEIIDTAVERRIWKQATPPENPINGQLWLDTSNPDKPILKEYFNGIWVVRIKAVTEADDIGAITRAQAMYEAIMSSFNNIQVLHEQLLTQANIILVNKYLNQTNKDNVTAKLHTLISTYNTLKTELDKYKSSEKVTLEQANKLQMLMIDYTNAVKQLQEAITVAENYAMEHLAILQSQYSEEKYLEALNEVAEKFGLRVEEGKLIGDADFFKELTDTRDSLQSQLDTAKATLDTLKADNTTNKSKISVVEKEIIDLEDEIGSKVSQADYDLTKGKVDTMSTQVSQTAEALTNKAEKSEVNTIKNTVDNHSSQITQSAEKITTLLENETITSNKLTTVSNKVDETAEGLTQTISKVTQAESDIKQAKADITANTTEISNKLSSAQYQLDKENIVTRLDASDSERTQLSNEIKDRVTITDYNKDKEDTTGKLSTLETAIEQNGKAINLKASQTDLDSVDRTLSKRASDLEVKATGITSTVEGLNDDLKQAKTTINQSIEGITQRVDSLNVGTYNLIPQSDFTQITSFDSSGWKSYGGDSSIRDIPQYNNNVLLALTNNPRVNTSTTNGAVTPVLTQEVSEGKEYTLTFYATGRNTNGFRYCYLMNTDNAPRSDGSSGNQSLTTPEIIEGENLVFSDYSSTVFQRYKITFKATFTGRAKILIGSVIPHDEYSYMYMTRPQLVEGSVITSFTPSAGDNYAKWSEIKQTTDNISTEVGKKVGNDEIISRINQSAEKVSIDADKINLTAGSSIDLAIQNTAHPNPNLIPMGNFWSYPSEDFYRNHALSVVNDSQSGIFKDPSFGRGWVKLMNSTLDTDTGLTYMWTQNSGRNRFRITAGQEYTFSILVAQNYHGTDLDYCYIREVTGGTSQINLGTSSSVKKTKFLVGQTYGRHVYKYVFTFTPNFGGSNAYMFFGLSNKLESRLGYYFSEWKLEAGNQASPYNENYASKDHIISAINADTSGVMISGDKVSINANDITIDGSKINIGSNPSISSLKSDVGQASSKAESAQEQADRARNGNNVVNSINNSGTTVRIMGNNINLTGNVSFENSYSWSSTAKTRTDSYESGSRAINPNVMKDWGLTTISGGRIQTDQMTAKRVNIVRSDGVTSIDDGKIRAEYGINSASPEFMSHNPTENGDGLHFWRRGAFWVTNRSIQSKGAGAYGGYINYFEFLHTARYLRVALVMNVENTGFIARIKNRAGTINEATSVARRASESDSRYDVTKVLTADLGKPTYKRMNFYLYFQPNSQGSSADWAMIRIFHTMLTDESQIPAWLGDGE